jgi:hypothetical protein
MTPTRRLDRGDLPGAHAAVVAEPVDVDAIRAAAAVDLERHRLAGVDADVGGEALDLQVARSVDVPFGRWIPRLAVFRDDPVRRADAV